MVNYQVQKGAFFKHCPCSPEAVSCGYFNLNLHTGCPYSCSYCILQSYLNSKDPVFFSNFEQMETELDSLRSGQKFLRIGTGELSDSLAWDNQTGYSQKLLQVFQKYPEIVFEFKTKSNEVGNLLSPKKVLKNIVVSWSLNPRVIIRREELLTPGLTDRLNALKAVQSKGYKIGIHFDPLIIFPGWKIHYQGLIKQLAQIINPGQVAWWSMGALRFPVSLKEHIFKYKDSILFKGELIKGYDHKYRYFKPLRLELFQFIKRQINENLSQEIPLYLCMEDQEAWEEILPGIRPDEGHINRYLYEQALK